MAYKKRKQKMKKRKSNKKMNKKMNKKKSSIKRRYKRKQSKKMKRVCSRSKYRRKRRTRKQKKYKRVQRGCSRKQRGGNACIYNCEYPNNMGEIVTGTKQNLHYSDLTPHTTQNRHPNQYNSQQGGGIIGYDGLGTGRLIDFGGSSLLTGARQLVNDVYNVKNTWNADHKVESADPVVATDRMDNS